VICHNPALTDVDSGATQFDIESVAGEIDCRGSAALLPITPVFRSPSILPALNRRFGMPENAFGAIAWRFFFGDVGVEPPLPADIADLLKSPCPFWPGKRIEETHTLVLVPATVNGKPLTLDSLGEMIERPRNGGNATRYSYYWEDARKQLGQTPAPAAHWVLMTTDVLPNTRKKTYEAQAAEVKKYGGYEVPSLLEGAVAILMGYIKAGTCWYGQTPLTYTRCQEKVEGYQMALGGHGASGLFVGNDLVGEFEHLGVGALRQFRS
jgi:hypothetical protein